MGARGTGADDAGLLDADGERWAFTIFGISNIERHDCPRTFINVRATSVVPKGRHFLSMEFMPTGAPDVAHGKGVPGEVRLFVDGAEVGVGEIPVTSPVRLGQGAAMLVGSDAGSAVTPAYEAPFRFQGRIKRVIVDVSGEHVGDYETEMRIALAKD